MAELKDCCEKKQVVAEPVVNNVPEAKEDLNTVVVFRIGKSVIDTNQEINIYNAAQFLKENPEAKVVISSYADKKNRNSCI